MSFFMIMEGVIPLLLLLTSCFAGNGRFWNNLYSPDMSPCDYDLLAKVKKPLRGTRYNTRDELIRAIEDGQYGISRKVDALMVYDAFPAFGTSYK